MEKEIISSYKLRKEDIKKQIIKFKSLDKKEYFKEFLFCILTPQSNAKKCWEAVENLSLLENWNQKNISNILKSKTRFHNNKTKYILESKKTFENIMPLLEKPEKIELRNEIAKKVKGYGLKEASHFLRNIGKSENQIAILDRHILRNLKNIGTIKEDKIRNNSHYFEIENSFKQLSEKLKIPLDELDLLFWSKETGEIFK